MTSPILSSRGKRGTKPPKPSKPRRDYPLFAHASGQWAKKVQGKVYYFGVWSDPIAAEAKWERDKLAILEGRNPNDSQHGDSIEWLCNTFMDSKARQHDRGELSRRALDDYHRICKHVATHFGKARRLATLRSPDIEAYRATLPTTWSPTSTNNHLRLARVLFKYANDIEATDRDIPYRIGLKQVPKSIVRKHEATKPAREFTVEEIWRLHDAAPIPIRAFILLGLNCAYGTADIGRLRIDQIDFENQWLGAMRGKTGVARGAWLWPETIAALQEAIDAKPHTTSARMEPLAFVTKLRRPWGTDDNSSNPLSQAFRDLKTQVGIEKKGVGQYALRHMFETVAGDARDQQAVDYVMGHMDNSIAGNYRHGIDPERVKAVCSFVRDWFLAGKPRRKAK
jgi:integrase